MSNANCESAANLTAVSSENPSAKAKRAASGLETIVLALQALQKEPRRKVDEGEPASKLHISTLPISKLPTANLPTTTPTNFPPIPHGINSARRVVSTDSIGVSDTDSAKLQQHPPQVKEEETVSTSEKASDSTRSAAVETTTSSSVQSSPDPSPPPSEMTGDDVLISSDDTSKAADFSQILADPEGWLKQTENLFAKLPPLDRSTDKEIIVQPNDVLCGRGGETNHHPGNIRYRSLVKAYQKLYLLAKRRDKPKIAQCIVVSVRGVEGRFLKRAKNANKGSAWVDVGNVKAREKTSQALREGAPNLRENVAPPGTTSASNDGTSATNTRQVLVPDQAESVTTPPTAAPQTLSTSAPTALESMMGWKYREPAKASAPVPSVTSSSVPHVSSSPASPPSDADNDAYLKLFTQAASQLMQHPAFHQLDQARQYEAILFECKNARAAVESAKRNSTGTTTAANVHDQGRTSPMIPTSMNHQQAPQPQQHRQPYPTHHEYPYYPHGQQRYYPQVQGSMWPANNPKNPSSMDVNPEQALSLLASKFTASQTDKSVNLQNMYRELLVAKAAASTGLSSGLASTKTPVGEPVSTEEQRRKTKKRPASCSSSSVHSISPAAAVVSDTGSDASSSSSSCESLLASSSAVVKDENPEADTSISRGGSRLKRLKLRMKDDFN